MSLDYCPTCNWKHFIKNIEGSYFGIMWMTHILNSLTTVVTKCSLDLFGRFKGCNCNNHLINNTHLVVKNRVQLDRYVLLICRVIMSFDYTLEFHALTINTFEKSNYSLHDFYSIHDSKTAPFKSSDKNCNNTNIERGR